MGVVYRDDSEVIEWRKRDPLVLFEARLLEMNTASAGELQQLRERVLFEVEEAIAFAEASPFPADSALLEDVYTVTGG